MARMNQGDLRLAFALVRYQLEVIQQALGVLLKTLDGLDELVAPAKPKAADDGKS